MSADLNLADALELARERMEKPQASRELKTDEDVLAILRGAATLYGLNQAKVEADFISGGALADLVRAVIGAEAKRRRPRGRPKKLEDSWITFVQIRHLMRSGQTLELAISELAQRTKSKESKLRSQYDRTRDDPSVDPAAVPASIIEALFADPRRRLV